VRVYLDIDMIAGVITATVFVRDTLRARQVLGGVNALAGMGLASTDEARHA
jgi:hypothetical protein